ncbi:MAG: SpoIIE family protein phosphatase [Anaerolineae bacterium]|nr:SpoIIE family protein phosphatase [Anaerolineae bacterium]
MTNAHPIPPVANPEHLATLYEITRELNSSLDLNVVLENIMDRVIEVTGAERGFLMLRDENTNEMEFQVARGMDRSDLVKPEFQISTSITGKVQKTGLPLLTDNAEDDERFTRGDSILIMGLRSILCVPIAIRGRLIGLVYVDNRLHVGLFNEGHRDLVAAFASQAGIAIENARLYQVAVEKGRMEKELQMAKEIQKGWLPQNLPIVPGYELAAYWRAAREIAGDFYDCFYLPTDDLGIVMADVSDKGAPAALFMAMSRSLIRSAAMTLDTPEAGLRQANMSILNDTESGMFVTVYFTVLHPNGMITGINAGHNCPLVVRPGAGTHEFLPRGGRPLGWFEDLPIAPIPYQLEPGDVLVLYTDGVTECENVYREQYGEDRLVDVTYAHAHRSADEILDAISASVLEFMGDAPPFDDTTLFVVRYTG